MLAMQDILICIDLDNIQTLCIFVLPKTAEISESERNIFYSVNKAGSLYDNSSSEVLRSLARLGGLASFFIHRKLFSYYAKDRKS